MQSSGSFSPLDSIGLPAFVVYCGGELLRLPPADFCSSFAPAGRGMIRCSNGSNPKFQVTLILDRRGHIYRLEPVGKDRACLSFLAKLWDWTLTNCRLEVVGPVAVDDLLGEARAWTNPAGRRLVRHLQKLDPNAIFDEVLFRRAWEAVADALPESDWEKEFRLIE